MDNVAISISASEESASAIYLLTPTFQFDLPVLGSEQSNMPLVLKMR